MATMKIRKDGVLIIHDDGRKLLYSKLILEGVTITLPQSKADELASKDSGRDVSIEQQRVLKSIEFLNQRWPGWWYKINLRNVTRNIGERIILQRPGVHRDNVIDEYKRLGLWGKLDSYAFSTLPSSEEDDEWKRELVKLRSNIFTG